MTESIPVAPEIKPDKPLEADLEPPDLSEGFDEDILADIERSLSDDSSVKSGSFGEKVELDKADLPLIWEEEEDDSAMEPEPEEFPAEVEVDLSGQAPAVVPDLGLEEKKPGKGLKFWLIMGGGLVVLLALLAVGAAYYLGYFDPPKAPEPEVQRLAPYQAQGVVPDPIAGLRYDLKPFIVPLQPSSKGRILRVVISLEVNEPQDKEGIVSNERMCRDVLYRMLRDRPAQELETARSRRLLHAQVKAQINSALKKDLVYKVYFTEFVITG